MPSFHIDIDVSMPAEGFSSPIYQQARVLAAAYQTQREQQGMGIAVEFDEAHQYCRDTEVQIKEWMFDPLTAAAATLMKVVMRQVQ